MFKCGDIVKTYAPQAGKNKFHLCVYVGSSNSAYMFLYLNSKPGFRGDYVLVDGEIPGLSISPTGKTVISFSLVLRHTEQNLKMYKAIKVAELSPELAERLYEYAQGVQTLNKREKEIVLEALEKLKHKNKS